MSNAHKLTGWRRADSVIGNIKERVRVEAGTNPELAAALMVRYLEQAVRQEIGSGDFAQADASAMRQLIEPMRKDVGRLKFLLQGEGEIAACEYAEPHWVPLVEYRSLTKRDLIDDAMLQHQQKLDELNEEAA